MTKLSKPAQIDQVRNRVVEEHTNKYHRWTIIAFSGDLKHWTGFAKGKPRF